MGARDFSPRRALIVGAGLYGAVCARELTDAAVAFTRILEHKHFDLHGRGSRSLITREFPAVWQPGSTPFYPVNTAAYQTLYRAYREMADGLGDQVTFGGHLGEYRDCYMHQVIASAWTAVRRLLSHAPAAVSADATLEPEALS